MMRIAGRIFPLLLPGLSVVCLMLCAAPASASSFGISANGAFAFSTFNLARSSSSVDYSGGAGFVLDTAVGEGRFNYRLNFGYDNVIDSGSRFVTGPSMHRIIISNAFGFGLIKTEKVRIWMGPEVGLSCQFNTYRDRKFFVIFQAGAVLGINLNAGNGFTFSVEFGLRGGGGPNMNYKMPIGSLRYGYGYGYPGYRTSTNESGIAKVESFARVAMLFRIGSANDRSGRQ